MVLNYIWIGFFILAFVAGLMRLAFAGDAEVFPAMMNSAFSMARTGFDISLGLTGAITLWLGIMKIGERGGAVELFSRMIGPFFRKILPGIPEGHPAIGSVIMNVAANMLGLDNAATPLGLKAMREMQALNPDKDTASDAQIMFLVLNTSGLTVIPVSIMVYRAQLGAADPSDVFLPILLSTYFSTLAGLLVVALRQRIRLWDRTIMGYLGGISAVILGVLLYFSSLPKEDITRISSLVSNLLLFSVIVGFIVLAVCRRVNVYESFIEGAREGFSIAVRIIPYLIAILVAVGVFRASGAMDVLTGAIGSVLGFFNMDADFVPALPTALMKPLSGSGARGMMVDAMTAYGADSFVGRLAATFQGATDTTFYIIAVYFGAVGIRKTRYAVSCGLAADCAGMVAAVFVAYLFFH